MKSSLAVIPGRRHKRVHARLRRAMVADPESVQQGFVFRLDSGFAGFARARNDR
jgi:hypothetical protein